jgi:diacylglycerol O-acyltransferase
VPNAQAGDPAERLGAMDVSFLYLDSPTTPMHVGGLAIFDPPAGGFDYDALVGLVERRLPLVPRYRQKVRRVPGNIAFPVWIDDPDFDVTFHVRRSALPRPGSWEQLTDLVARLQARPLDHSRPLWEFYLVEGLQGGQLAVISKTHSALVDGIRAVDIAQVILSRSPDPDVGEPLPLWMPAPEPSAAGLVVSALSDLVQRPAAVQDAVLLGFTDARAFLRRAVGVAGEAVSAVRVAARPAPASPLNIATSAHRRVATVASDLAKYKLVRECCGGTVNDVVLTVVTGALRGWLLARGEAVTSSTSVRAMVPVSVRDDAAPEGTSPRVTPFFLDLPVGEPNPLVRLSHVSYAMRAHQTSGRSVSADGLLALSGFAPPTLHALATRAAARSTRRLFNLVITNVPGPQVPMYAGGAQLAQMYPIVPLARDQALSIGLTSYAGGLFYGLNGDRDALADIDVIADLLEESLTELVDAAQRTMAPVTAPSRGTSPSRQVKPVRSSPAKTAPLRPGPVSSRSSGPAVGTARKPGTGSGPRVRTRPTQSGDPRPDADQER